MDSKEQLIYFFLNGKINLSTYDEKFLTNLGIIINTHKRVTTNQAKLFDRLVEKYQRQLNKHSLHYQDLVKLNWKANVVESATQYTNAKVSLVNDNLTITLPFNKNFISAFKNVDDNPFDWNKSDRMYVAKFSTYALKIASVLLPEFFTVDYSVELLDVLNTLKEYENSIWKPTLCNVNGNLMIVAINEMLYDATINIDLKLDIPTLYELSHYGISVDEKLISNEPSLKFANEYVTEVDLDDILQVANWLSKITDNVFVPKNTLYITEMIRVMDRFNIKVDTMRKKSKQMIELVHSVRKHSSNRVEKTGKIIVIKNSRPVEVQ
jgi:hypothetical protein